MKSARLADILTFPVHTVSPEIPVSQALARMREWCVSALVVVDERQHPLGIFTERDAVRLVYQREQTNTLAVGEVMSKPPMSATPDLGFLPAYGLMAAHRIRHLVVVDGEGRLAGIVTEGDFIRHFRFQHLIRTRDVASVMLQALTTLPEDALVREAAHLMAKQHLECVIVEKAGEAAGILTERDLVRVIQEGDSGQTRTLGEAMSRPVAAILPDAPLSEAIRRMDELKVRRLLVTDANGQFIGLVTHHQIAAVLQPETPPPARMRLPRTILAGFPAGRARAWIYALLAAMLVVATEQVIEHFARQRALEMEKNGVLSTLSALRARLEGVVNANLFLVHGLTAIIAAKPDMDQAEFAGIARNLVDERHALRNIAAAPNLVISLMYPLAGNEAAIGLDYRTHPEQRQAALRARDSGHSVLAGPLRLQQGGIGIIAREPVFLSADRPGGERRFWGLVSAVIDVETLYRKAGLRDPGMSLDLALRGSDGSGARGPVFFGDTSVFVRQPVTLDITLPGGTWQIAAQPAAGWGQSDTSVNLIRLMGLLAAMAAATMAFWLARGHQALRETAARWRESQNLFEHFMANLPAGAYIRDTADAHMLFQNRWLCDHLPGRDEAGSESSTDPAMAAIDQRVPIEGAFRRQENLTTAHGAPLICDIQRFLIPRAGAAPLVGGIISDVSARVRAEQQLASQSARLIALLKTIPDLVWLKDPEGVYLACNPRFEHLYGAREADIIGKTDHDFVPAEQAEAFQEKDRAAIAAGGPRINEEWVTFARDGHRELLETIKTPVFDDQGMLMGVLGIARDITARKQTEAALQESEMRLRLFIDHAPAALAMFDREMRYLAVSRRWLSDYHLENRDILGHSHYEIFSKIPQRWKDVHQRGLAGEVVRASEDRFEQEDGSAQWLRWEVRPWHEASGAIGGIVIFSEDITARKDAEEQARQGELVLDSVFRALPDLFFLMDADGTIRDYRGGKHGDLYVPPEVFLNQRMQVVLPTEQSEMFASKLAEIQAKGGLATYEYNLDMPDGPRQFEARLTGLPDSTQVIAVIRDITRQHRDRVALAASEARYRSLLEMAPFPAVLTRVRDGILVYGNHRAEIQYGIKREAGIGQAADRFYEDPAERARFVEAIRQRGQVNDLELRMRSADGRAFWALVSASVVAFDDEPTIFAAINDITARKQAEAALKEQETFFRLIAENMGDMVAVLDPQGRRLYNSPSYRELFGDLEALKGTDSFAEIHPDDRERVRTTFAETVRTGVGQRINFRFVLTDGGIRDIESQGGVIRDAAGQVERVVVVSRDITERKRLEDEIRQLNADLEERVRLRTTELATANKELETFTYSVSHDLKAPLRGIDGYSRLLLEDHLTQLDEEGRLFLNNVRHGVEQMGQLIEDLLAYSRMERRNLNDQILDLSALVAGLLDERRADIEARGMQVEVALAGLTARADPDGLALVLRNLIDNALKFSRDSLPPTLKISGVSRPGTTILEIKDNGIGFDMRFHDRIFDIFQRLQRAEDYPGTGVGLAIVRKAMQRMGGQIRAESAPGAGATFYLELPR